MFIAEHHIYVSRRKKPYRRYWWASFAFAMGVGIGCSIAHLI